MGEHCLLIPAAQGALLLVEVGKMCSCGLVKAGP